MNQNLVIAVCRHCKETIYLISNRWLCLYHPVFPQYCPDEFQNQDKNQKHEPIKEN